MGGIFGIVSEEAVNELSAIESMLYGTDYHSHLGTKRGGLASFSDGEFFRYIHDITNAQFRSKFELDIKKFKGQMGIGVISDLEDQPLVINSHLGRYAIASVNRITNLDELVRDAFQDRRAHFAETGRGELNPTEVIATLITQENNFVKGIERAQEAIRGSCSLVLLTPEGIYAARDKLGRTPLSLGKRGNSYAVTSETTAFPNLGFNGGRDLMPGEIVLINRDGIEQKKKPNDRMQMCSFLWVYFGYPSSTFESVNVESAREKCGAALAREDAKDVVDGKLKIDFVAGIPDSGTAHAIGYANESGVPFRRPFIKYTPTWPRSFMPPDQAQRDIIARMKLVPIKEMVQGKSILFCEDSIVRGTQLRDTIKLLYAYGAEGVHMRPACPPLVYGCDFLNFSRSRSANELAGQRAIRALEGIGDAAVPLSKEIIERYAEGTENFGRMVDWIRRDLNLTTLKYQKLTNLMGAIGLPKERLCTHCWDGSSYF